jgi:hypothetical protein
VQEGLYRRGVQAVGEGVLQERGESFLIMEKLGRGLYLQDYRDRISQGLGFGGL